MALLAVIIARVSLWLLPFRTIHAAFERLSRTAPASTNHSESIDWQIARAVQLVSRFVPHSTCLIQALATQALLLHYAVPGQLRIGVTRSTQGTIEAHAWVERHGRVIIGGSTTSVAHFTVLGLAEREQA
jgi:hypothetical protein